MLSRSQGPINSEQSRELDGVHAELSLLGSNDVINQSNKVIIAINDRFMREKDSVMSLDGRERSTYENFVFEQENLKKLMRKDLLG
jgi:hypothetical protein